MLKTNAVRVLDGLEIKYGLREYKVDPDDLSAGTVAAKIGLPAEQLFKTLAVRGDRNGIFLAVISANDEVDFKALAHQTGESEGRHASFKRSASRNWLHSWRSYRSGVQERLPSIYR